MKSIIQKLAALAMLMVGVGVANIAFGADGQLRFGLEASYKPFESKLPNGQLEGFDIDIGQAVCAKLNVQCVWVENAFDGLIPALKARKFDAINSAMTLTEQRRRAIDFTEPIYRIPSRLIAKREVTLLPNTASLKGKHVGVLQGSIQEKYANVHWAPAGVRVVPYQTQDQVYADLIAGRLDAGFQDTEAASKGLLSQPHGAGFSFSGPIVVDDKLLGAGVAFGVRKGNDALKEKLDQALKALKADGSLKRIAEKYFDMDVVLD